MLTDGKILNSKAVAYWLSHQGLVSPENLNHEGTDLDPKKLQFSKPYVFGTTVPTIWAIKHLNTNPYDDGRPLDFVIKETRDPSLCKSEVEKYKSANKYLNELYDTPDPNSKLPTFASLKQAIVYHDDQGVLHCYQLMPAAKGQYFFDKRKVPVDLNKMYSRLGESLGALHASGKLESGISQYVHHDLAPGNIFYDQKSDTITFIDLNEFGPGPVEVDVVSVISDVRNIGPGKISQIVDFLLAYQAEINDDAFSCKLIKKYYKPLKCLLGP